MATDLKHKMAKKEVAPSVIKGVSNMSYLPNLENVRNVLKKRYIHLFLACAGIFNVALTVAALARKVEYVLQPFLLHELLQKVPKYSACSMCT